MDTEPNGLLFGRLPGQRKGLEWVLFYVELSGRNLHIYEGNEDPSRTRRHLRSLEVNSTDTTGIHGKDKKREYKFYYNRGYDGKYLFKSQSPDDREKWIMSIQRIIQKREYMEKGLLSETDDPLQSSNHRTMPVPFDTPVAPTPNDPRSLAASSDKHTPLPPPHRRQQTPAFGNRDSGFISGSGVVTRTSGFSDDSDVHHSNVAAAIISRQSHSADAMVSHRTQAVQEFVEDADMTRYAWYWGPLSRQDCEKELKERGTVGNFVVRMNTSGDYVMSFWRKDGIHHHRILKNGELYRFEKSAVRAEGYGIPDLLDTYMKHCSDKTIGPFGGQLYPEYDEAWNPPDIDFNKFEEHLKGLKGNTNRKIFRPGQQMADNTYGGKTLHEMKDVLRAHHNSSQSTGQGSSPSLSSGSLPGMATRSPTRGKKLTPVPQPKPKKLSQPEMRVPPYVNLTGHTANVSTPPPPSYPPPGHQDDDPDDEQEDEYIAPSQLRDDAEEGECNQIYQNLQSNGIPEQPKYLNVGFAAEGEVPSESPSLYQNVDFSPAGKAKPKVRPRLPKKPQTHH